MINPITRPLSFEELFYTPPATIIAHKGLFVPITASTNPAITNASQNTIRPIILLSGIGVVVILVALYCHEQGRKEKVQDQQLRNEINEMKYLPDNSPEIINPK